MDHFDIPTHQAVRGTPSASNTRCRRPANRRKNRHVDPAFSVNGLGTAGRLQVLLVAFLLTAAAWGQDVGAPEPRSGSGTLERVIFQQADRQREVAGRVVVEAQDGGLLLEGPDHAIWIIQPQDIRAREQQAVPFTYQSRDAVKERLLAELPTGFAAHETAHYLIVYNTSPAYAQWCGALYERLYRAFFNFWQKKGVQLHEPDYLVSLVFRDRAGYEAYGASELGSAAGSIVGYYSLATNRITTYDLTGMDELVGNGRRSSSQKHINALLSQPAAERTVATIIHEATHQLAYNSGLQVRFADNPLWLSEGLAIYFEAPDLSSARGWRRIGALHPLRLQTLRNHLPQRAPDALLQLLTDDRRLREVATAEVAYAEAWALCYFLIRHHGPGFRAYLQEYQQKSALGDDGAEIRLQTFQRCFGHSWQEIDAEFRRAVMSWD